MSDALKIFKLYSEALDQEPQMSVLSDGTKQWRLNGELHRVDGPAVIGLGEVRWMQHGKFHREGGPAVKWEDGSEFWYLHGKMHRLDGPALKMNDVEDEWWIDDRRYNDITSWARAALEYEHKPITQDNIDAKIQQVMQQDLFS
jgi:hypothetical protein